MTTKLWRHGDICGIKIVKLPEELKETKTTILEIGSHGHSHSINQGKVYFKKDGEHIFGYLVAKDTFLDHDEHGKLELTNGVYELRKQTEYTPQGLIPVVD